MYIIIINVQKIKKGEENFDEQDPQKQFEPVGFLGCEVVVAWDRVHVGLELFFRVSVHQEGHQEVMGHLQRKDQDNHEVDRQLLH